MTERLTAKELSELERLWESNRNEKWNHEAAVSLGCVVRPVLPRLIAMAQRLLELESAKPEVPLSVRVQLTDSGEFAFYPFARRATRSEGTREQVLISLMRGVCEEIGVPEEKSERAPILEALNDAYNLGHGHGSAARSGRVAL